MIKEDVSDYIMDLVAVSSGSTRDAELHLKGKISPCFSRIKMHKEKVPNNPQLC